MATPVSAVTLTLQDADTHATLPDVLVTVKDAG
jgi:hypothetical protein